MIMRTKHAGTALLAAAATAALLAGCGGEDPADPGAANVPSAGPSTPTELTDAQRSAYEVTAKLKLPETEDKVVWSGTVAPGASYELPEGVQPGAFKLDLVCVGEGEAYIEFALGTTGVTTSVPCAAPGALTTRPLESKEPGKLKVSGGGGAGTGSARNVLVGRLTRG